MKNLGLSVPLINRWGSDLLEENAAYLLFMEGARSMKRLDEYTEAELEQISPEEIGRLIDRECAEEGVRLLPPEPTPPTEKVSKPDLTFYKVGSLIFEQEDEAQAVVDLVNSIGAWGSYYHGGVYAYDGPQGVMREEPIEYSRVQFWSTQLYESSRTELAARKEQTKRYEEERRDYQEVTNARQKIEETVRERIAGIKSAAQRRQRLKAEFEEYVELVEDKEKAFQCMVKAGRCPDNECYRMLFGLPARASETLCPPSDG